MACCALSGASATPKTDQQTLSQKPITKVTLFVISLLFAGGAVASHLTSWGVPGIVAFSVAGGGCMTAFMILCIRDASQSKPAFAPSAKANVSLPEDETAPQKPLQSTPNEETSHVQYELLTDVELVQQMTPWVQPSEEDLKNPAVQKNRCLLTELSKRITTLITTLVKSGQGQDQVAQALKPLFSAVSHAPDKRNTLAMLVAVHSNCVPASAAGVLEKLECPNDVLSKYLGIKIANKNIPEEEENYVCHNVPFRTVKLSLDLKSIFGTSHIDHPMPDSLAGAINVAIRQCAQGAMQELRQDKEKGAIDEQTKIGIKLVIAFSVSTVTPLLPYLKNIPDLVSLQLSPADNKDIFGDNHKDALLEIAKTNLSLTQIQIDVSGMSAENREDFTRQLRETLKLGV